MTKSKQTFRICTFFFLLISSFLAKADTILMFVSHEQTYYTEYVVMKEALEAAGYTVEVRSASALDFSIYMSPYSDIPNVANGLEESNYEEFQIQFQAFFDSEWNESLNTLPNSAPTSGTLLEVDNFDNYVGLVVVGGLGALDYRVDGNYNSQGVEDRLVSAELIQQTAEHLNTLAIEALLQGKPVMAQCHGASIPTFWRIPDTSGPGKEALGYSLLKGEISAGYPESATLDTLESLSVTYRPNDRVTISNPHSSLTETYSAAAKIITTRDWFPQTVAHAARTFLNVLETFPTNETKEAEINTLVIHGGALDPENCGPGNKDNDVPCNHGGRENLPADYTHLMSLLNANEGNDDFNFVNDHLDLNDTQLDLSDEEAMSAYFSDYDVIVFFKHWSTLITDELQEAIVTFADDGGGVVGLHHALYNDQHGDQNKGILVTQLFGAESSPDGWAANLATFNMYATNHGHFISSYQIEYDNVGNHPTISSWTSDPLPATTNTSFSTLPYISMFDELYANFNYTGDISLGRDINEITPLFSNDALPPNNSPTQTRQTGFTRLVDLDGNGDIGKVAYMALGERRTTVSTDGMYGQMIRNAVMWAAPEPGPEKLAQTISFDELPDLAFGTEPFALSATSSSELTVSFTVVDGPAQLINGLLVLTGTGTVEIGADQNGNDQYDPAEQVIQSFEVTKAEQIITIDEVSDLYIGDESFNISATTTSNLELSYEVTSGPATNVGSLVTLTGETGVIWVTISQAGNDNYLAASVNNSFNVNDANKTNQTITFDELSDRTYGGEPLELSATSSSTLAVSFSVSSGPAIFIHGLLTLTGTGTVVIAANQSGNDEFNPASPVIRSFEVSQANQIITFIEIADQAFSEESIILSASSSSELSVQFTLISGPASLENAELTITGIGTIVVEASQSGNNNYLAAEVVQQEFTVEKAAQEITFEAIDDLLMISDPFELVAQASSGLEVTFTVEGPAEINGTLLTLEGSEGLVIVTALQAGNENYLAASTQQSFESQYVLGTNRVSETLTVYPNPASDLIRISSIRSELAQIEIYHINGARLINEMVSKHEFLDVQRLLEGLYFMRITEKENITTTKILIAR